MTTAKPSLNVARVPARAQKPPRAEGATRGDASDPRDLLADRALSRIPETARAAFKGCLHLFSTNEEVTQYNEFALEREEKPVVRIYALHTGGVEAEKKGTNIAGGLDRHFWVMEGAKVMLTANIWMAEGLTNGVVGTLSRAIFKPGSDPRKRPGKDPRESNLPIAVLVHFPHYTGPSEWTDDLGQKLVPIVPSLMRWEGKGGKPCSRRQLPLRLAYSLTIHKAQGLTLERVVVHRGEKEFTPDLAFVACSRVETLTSLVFIDSFPP